MNPLSTIIMMICLMEIIECRRYNYVMKNRKRTMPKITKSEDNFEFKIKVLQHDRNKTTKTMTTFVVDDHKQTITTMSTIIDDNSLIKKTKSNGLKTTKSNGQKTTKSKEKPTRPREKTTKSMEKSTRPQEQSTRSQEKTTKSMEKTTKSKTETTKSKEQTTTKSSETPPPSTKLKEKSTIPNEQTTKSEGTSVQPPPPSKTSKPPPSRPTTLSGKFFERLESFYNLLDDYYRDEPIQYWFLLFTFEIFLFIFGYFLGSQSQNREKF